MAGGACRLWNAGRVGIFAVPLVTGGARHRRMGARSKLRRLVMTGGAIGCEPMDGRGAKKEDEYRDE